MQYIVVGVYLWLLYLDIELFDWTDWTDFCWVNNVSHKERLLIKLYLHTLVMEMNTNGELPM